ncbi:twin-arginine translocation signal domain-containing protein [Glycomyces sp. YM15]|uniref:twin-arginine translocation signal domain-containing protein n=1 Tax=Glycomyces sp. YM15 TaxID=2800446 RepID=UPI0019634511|nr:twin-arginine translocation signal domain-containing protein [Glycomyces sp. YM15]
MAAQSDKPNLSRRRLLQAAAIVPAVAIPTLVVASPAQAYYMGNISRSNVMTRAKDWYDRGIQYDQGSTATDNDGGHRYRRDCSGFVSMAWHSATPGHSTRTLSDISHPVYWSSLLPGDIVNSYDNHCMLFAKWVEKGVSMKVYHLVSPSADMKYETKYVTTLKNADYSPLRYDKIFD